MRTLLSVGLLLATALAGCSTGYDSNAGGGQHDSTSVSSRQDYFAYSGSLGQQTKDDEWEWDNTGSKAAVAISHSSQAGEFTLTLLDSAGLEVYSRTISGDASESVAQDSDRGIPGAWTVSIDMRHYSGSVSISARAT